MRIISSGNIQEAEVECKHCGAKIGYYPADLINKYISKFIFTYLKCPVCGDSVVISRIENTEERN